MNPFSQNQNQEDSRAIDRYLYMLRTAPPEAIEQAHQEAFAKLTPEQRRRVLEALAKEAPPAERARATDDPQSLARLATRTELRQPGILERIFSRAQSPMAAGAGGMGLGMGMGGLLAGSLLSSLAGSFIGTAIAQQFFDHHPYEPGYDMANVGSESEHGRDPGDENPDTGLDETPDTGFDDSGGFDDFGGYGEDIV